MAKGTSNKINVDEIAKMFGITSWEDLDECNLDYYWESTRGMEREDDEDDDAFEERRQKAESDTRDELFGQWHDGVMAGAESEFGKHGLTLVPVKLRRKVQPSRPYTYRIVPVTSWKDAADGIRDTINGVGMFGFDTLRDFLDSGPYTAREAVLTHLHWIKDRSRVYGDASAQSIYARSFR